MNYLKKWFQIICCILVIITLSGCWSKSEPKTLELLESVIFDIQDNGKYKITAEIKNASSNSSTQMSGQGSINAKTVITSSEGNSLAEAIRARSKSIEKVLFGAHVKVRFLTEKFAKNVDLSAMLDGLSRDSLTYDTPFMVVIKSENPEMLYNCNIGLSESVGNFINDLCKTQPNAIAESVFTTTLDLIKDYYNEGKQPVMGVAEIVEDDNTTSQSSLNKTYKIKYKGLAAFKDDRLVGFLDGIETRAYNMITNNFKAAYMSVSCKDSMVSLKVPSAKADVKTNVDNNNITINIKVKINLNVIGVSGTLDVSKAENLKKVEESFNKQMQSEIVSAISKVQKEFASDIFGFGSYVHAEHPEKWKEIKDNWDDYFSKATVNVTVESSATRSGEIKEPLKTED